MFEHSILKKNENFDLKFTTTVVCNVYRTWGYNKIPIILFHVRSIWHQAVWSVSADSIRPNKTGTWLLIKCSFQKWTIFDQKYHFLMEVLWWNRSVAVFDNLDMISKISKIWYENIQNTGNNIVYFVKET